MTSGPIWRHLLSYAVPMILGNLLQLTYNAADSAIIGKTLGENSLAAVSAAGPIMTLVILGASGIGIGSAVIISRLYGAGDKAGVRREFATTVLFGAALSAVIFAAGLLLSEHLLAWIRTPKAVRGEALVYLRIIFVGFLFNFQYNILSHSLRAVGDTGTPVLFLGISCLLNIGLDVLFVPVLGWGVAGAAAATVVSEAFAAGLCVWKVMAGTPELRPEKKEFRIDRLLLRETVENGTLTALQQAAQPVGKVLIQGVINDQGVAVIDTFNAVCRVDDFGRIPAQSIGSGIMTCTAQNRGAGLKERVSLSLRQGMLTAVCYFPIVCILTLLLRIPAVRLLTPDGSDAMVTMGAEYLFVKAFLFLLPCLTNAVQGFMRGLGKMWVVLTATLIQISLRVLFVFLWVPRFGILGEAWASAVGWICMLVFEGLLLLLVWRRNPQDHSDPR